MVKNTFSQRLRGSIQNPIPQDILSIFLSDQRLQFVVADHLGQPHLLREYNDIDSSSSEELLKSVFSVDEDIRKTYSAVHLSLVEPCVLLQPTELSITHQDQDDLSRYFLPNSKETKRIEDVLGTSGAKIVYPVKDTLLMFGQQMFPNLTIHHHHYFLIEVLSQGAINLPGNRIYAHATGSKLSIVYLKDSKLQYANQFDVQNADDHLYYIMLIYNQFELDPSEDILSVSLGNDSIKESVVQLRSYIREVQVLEYKSRLKPSEGEYYNKDDFQRFYLPLSSLQLISEQ